MTSYIAPPPRCLSSKALGGKKQRKLLLPLVAIATFALVAFSIFAFIKLPAFAEDHAQDLNKTDVSRGDSASSGQDLNKTTVLCGGSASSAKQDAQDLSENRVSRGDSADPAEHEQDNSTQSVPSNEQAQTEQDSVITPPTAQDNCVQTHSAGQDLESNSPITHLNTQNSAQVPLRVQSTTITPKASTGANIALSDDAEATASGAGWTYDSATSVYTINSDATADANLTISGTTTNKRVVVAEGANATVTLSGASIDQSSSDNASGSVFGISSGSSVTLKLQGSNTLKSGCNWSAEIGYAGLNVPSEATLTIESAEEDARLTANGGISAAGIGGNGAGSGPQTVGTITINGGTINAESISATSVGINGGTVNANEGIAGENITISGGTVTSGSISATTSVYITGGTTIVSGGIWSTSVHISGADVTTSEGIEAENITINGGTVNAAGGIVAENITITGGLVYAYTSGGYGDPAAIGGESGTGTISITGGVVIATVGNQNSPGIGRGAGNSEGSISITGGTIISNSKIGLCNGEGKTATTISGHPIIFSTEINGYSNDPTNGVLVGGNDKYTLDISTTPITLTINENFTVPSSATFTIPAGVNVSIPSGKTLTVANGGTLDIKEGAILGVHETSQVINEEGATIIGNNKIVIKSNGSDVSAPTLQHVTSTSIIINPATLLSETGQEVEYAISTTNELSTEADWQTGTTFEELTPNTQYYIFARSKENATHKAGTAQVLQVKTEVDPETPEEISINPSEIQGAWVDANGVVHANQNGTITIILHEKLHDGKTVEAKLEDYDLSSSVDTDIIKDNTVTFPHASPHIITASLKSNSALTTQVLVEVEPVSTPVNPATPTTPDNPASGSNPSANNTSTIGAVAQTGVPASLLVVVMLMLLVVGAGFMRARRKMM